VGLLLSARAARRTGDIDRLLHGALATGAGPQQHGTTARRLAANAGSVKLTADVGS